MSLRSRLGMFVLTREEQRTIAFIVLAVVLGLLTQHYRHRPLEPSKTGNEVREHPPAPTRPDSRPR